MIHIDTNGTPRILGTRITTSSISAYAMARLNVIFGEYDAKRLARGMLFGTLLDVMTPAMAWTIWQALDARDPSMPADFATWLDSSAKVWAAGHEQTRSAACVEATPAFLALVRGNTPLPDRCAVKRPAFEPDGLGRLDDERCERGFHSDGKHATGGIVWEEEPPEPEARPGLWEARSAGVLEREHDAAVKRADAAVKLAETATLVADALLSLHDSQPLNAEGRGALAKIRAIWSIERKGADPRDFDCGACGQRLGPAAWCPCWFGENSEAVGAGVLVKRCGDATKEWT